MKRSLSLITLFIIVGILAAGWGAWVHHNTQQSITASEVMKSVTLFTQPRIVSPFTLVDSHNRPFTLKTLQGHWNLVFFGFTHCPQLCPTTLATLNQVYQQLQSSPHTTLPQIVFISIDPEQDNSEQIARYLQSFNAAFLGATGTDDQLARLTQELNVLYAKVRPPNSDPDTPYTIDHSGTILLMNPQGQFAGVFTLPHAVSDMVHDMKLIMANSQV